MLELRAGSLLSAVMRRTSQSRRPPVERVLRCAIMLPCHTPGCLLDTTPSQEPVWERQTEDEEETAAKRRKLLGGLQQAAGRSTKPKQPQKKKNRLGQRARKRLAGVTQQPYTHRAPAQVLFSPGGSFCKLGYVFNQDTGSAAMVHFAGGWAASPAASAHQGTDAAQASSTTASASGQHIKGSALEAGARLAATSASLSCGCI